MNVDKRFAMALYLISILIMLLIASTSAINETRFNKDIITPMQQMQRASYFTFVMLLNMVQDKIPRNTTFLMPSDRALSKAFIPENETLELLLRHSIPSLLSFDDLLRFPTQQCRACQGKCMYFRIFIQVPWSVWSSECDGRRREKPAKLLSGESTNGNSCCSIAATFGRQLTEFGSGDQPATG